MIQMGLQEIVDQSIPIHSKQRGLSWGWTTVIWLAYILSEGDHRKVSMQALTATSSRRLKSYSLEMREVISGYLPASAVIFGP